MLTVKDSATKTVTIYCDDNGTELHTAQVVYKASPRIVIFPFSYSAARGVQRKKISEVEYKGWSTITAIPKSIRPSTRLVVGDKRAKQVLRALSDRLPSLNKIVLGSPQGLFARIR